MLRGVCVPLAATCIRSYSATVRSGILEFPSPLPDTGPRNAMFSHFYQTGDVTERAKL